MTRRNLLKLIAGLPAFSAGKLLATPSSSSRLLLVFLRGGYDSANLLVPVSSSFYYESRPNIAIAAPGADGSSALALDADWGLHPALRDSIYPLYQANQVTFIPFAGSEDVSRSHFATQDTFELGQNPGSGRNYRSGFLNRLVESLQGHQGIAFTDQLPLVLQGSAQIANANLRSNAKQSIDERQSELLASMYRGTDLAAEVSAGFVVREDVAREMAAEMQAASRNALSTKGFELVAHRIARLMKGKYGVGFIDVGGWDTHVNQGGATGALASRLNELGRGLAAFALEMGSDWQNTVVVVASEFGRTLRENGNRGTDHGHGSVLWMLGGGVRGGKTAGSQVRVEAGSLFQDRDIPVLNEYRAILGGLFTRMYGLKTPALDHIFAGVKPRDVGLV